jgi:hypothetical protein
MFRNVEHWLFAPGDPRRLAALRIGLCAVAAARLTSPVFVGLADQPAELFRPISFMRAFGEMPSRGIVAVLQPVGIIALVLAAAGFRSRLFLPLGWVCAVVLHGMETSLGKVVHHDVLPLLAMMPLLAAPTDAAWSIGAHRSVPTGWTGWPVRTSALLVAGAYVFTGIAKLVFSGPAWVFGDNLRNALYASSDGRGGNEAALFIADRPLIAHVAAAGVLLFELTAWVPVVRPRFAGLYVAGAAAIHGGIWLAMGLDYSPWILTAAIVWVDWPVLVDRLQVRRGLSRASPTL